MKKQCEYTSIFALELTEYFVLRENQGRLPTLHFHYLYALDKYIASENLTEKALTPANVEGWLQSLPKNISVNTKISYISHYTQFAKYLRTLGITAFIPERPIEDRSYVPYVFSADEISRLFLVADSIAENTQLRQSAEIYFPLILRLLYGCGLRLKEALRLRIADINLQTGVLIIRNSKNKDRLVPMNSSLAEILKIFVSSQRSNASTDSYLLPNRKGDPCSNAVVRNWFNLVLKKAGITKPVLPRYRRNICLHCLRHTFACDSFRKQDRSGVDLYAAAPYLSTYMGHEKIYGTEIYLHMTAESSADIIEQTSAYSEGLFPEVPK